MAVATFVVAVLAATDKFYTVFPGFRPDPGDRISASLKLLAIEPDVSIKRWMGLIPTDQRPDLPHGFDNARGDMVEIRTPVDGHKHKKAVVRFSILDIASQRSYPPPAGASYRGPDDMSANVPPAVSVSAPSVRFITLLWSSGLRSIKGKYLLRMTMRDDATAQLLAVADSPLIANGKLCADPIASGASSFTRPPGCSSGR